MGYEYGNCTMNWGNLIDMFKIDYKGDDKEYKTYNNEKNNNSTISLNLNINEQYKKEVPIFRIK